MASGIDWGPVVNSLAATNWTAVFVAIVSGCAAVIGPYWLWKKQGEKERATVRASLFAEVAALVEIVDRRGFVAGLRSSETILRARQASPMQPFQGEAGDEYFEVMIDERYSRVYQGNVSRLGVLSENEAKQIVRFHQLADAVRMDVIAGGVLARGTSDPEDFGDTADLLVAALEIGRTLTASPRAKSWRFWGSKK